MPKKIDWMYKRKSCQTCKKADSFLTDAHVTVSETVDATKTKLGADEALKLLEKVDKVLATRGKSVVTFHLKKDRPDNETLLSHLIGPTGNLRAPTAKVGKTLIVGFHTDAYHELFGE
jgi:arsenate reductase-like glutaredoxin family protein